MPQLYMISKTGEAETITSHYLFALGVYRGLYIVNWAYRFYMEDFFDLIAIVAGGVQTALYCDFFYLYITKGVYVCACGSTCLQKLQYKRGVHVKSFQCVCVCARFSEAC